MSWTHRPTAIFLSCLLVAALAAGAVHSRGAAQHVLLVLDASGSMYLRLDDGRYRITAAKEALRAIVAQIPDRDDLHVGLRVYGANVAAMEPDACLDSELVIGVDGFDRDGLLEAIDAVQAQGATPIAYSLELALDDLRDVDGSALIVLVTDGAESCGGDVRGAVERLHRSDVEVELRIVGVALPPHAAASFEGLGTFVNVESTAALVDALATSLEVERGALSDVEVRLTRDGATVTGDVRVRLVDTLEGRETDLASDADGERFAARVPPGGYRVEVDDATTGERHMLSGVSVSSDDVNRFEVELGVGRAVTVAVETEALRAGDLASVRYVDAPVDVQGWLTVVGVDEPEHVIVDRAAAAGHDGVALVRVPLEVEVLEARFLAVLPSGVVRVLGRSAPFTALPLAATVEAPPEVPAGAPFEVVWEGPALDGDYLEVVPEGARDGAFHLAPMASTRVGSPATVRAPSEPGRYEVRYVLGDGRRMLATVALEVVDSDGFLATPDEIPAGAPFQVTWGGPANDGDYLTIVPAGAGDGRFHGTPSAHVGDGSPARLHAPPQPGAYEVRYVLGDGRRTLMSTSVEVGPPAVTLEAPAEVSAGQRFEVAWSGPSNEGDYVMIVPVGARDGAFHMVSSAQTRDGSPLALVAPERPGPYEVRFVLGGSRLQLLSVPVEVR